VIEDRRRVGPAVDEAHAINTRRLRRDVIVIGGSAGAVIPLIALLTLLPRALPAAMCVVLHRSPMAGSRLALVLGRRASLTVVEPKDGDVLRYGLVYVAPRDQHMVINGAEIFLDHGPKEHRMRPAIDPLFRTAAEFYGDRVVGVLLSGLGVDGATGLIRIKAANGLSLVQDPVEARFGAMPSNAIAKHNVDGVLSLDDIAETLQIIAAGGTAGVATPATC
jgi:two-component system, chemotaxis family, protein-glutamate methylesterase/glutaminase